MPFLYLLWFQNHGFACGGCPLTEETMNTNSESLTLLPVPVETDRDPSRCHHRFPNGKRCRLPGSDSQLGLCLRHFTLSAAAELSRTHPHHDAQDLSVVPLRN